MKNLLTFTEFLNESLLAEAKTKLPKYLQGKINISKLNNNKVGELCELLAGELGMNIEPNGGAEDFVVNSSSGDLNDNQSYKTILEEALGGEYTFDDLKEALKKFYKIK